MKPRAGAVAILVGLLALIAVSPALAQDQPASESDGGLDVSGGGSFGYIGGSGSPQGTIRGPGGGGAAKPAPAHDVDHGTPSAVGGGVVKEQPAVQEGPLEAEPTSGAEMSTASWIVVVFMLAGAIWLFRKLPKRV